MGAPAIFIRIVRVHDPLLTAIEMYQAMAMTFWLPQTEATLEQVATR